MNSHLILPVVVPFLSGIILLFFRKNRDIQRILSVVASLISFAVAIWLFWDVKTNGIQNLYVGNWKAPFGIIFTADLLSVIMVMVSAIIGLSTSIFSLATMDKAREHFGYYPLLQIMIMGINGSFMTGDLFNMFVWFEVLLISSFVLIVLGGTKQQVEGGIKYVTINLLSSLLFVTAVGILYALVGALNYGDIAQKIPLVQHKGMINLVAMMFLISFGIKAAIFPLFFWLPASYHTPPAAVSAIFAGMLTKVGVYALYRVFTLLFIHDLGFTHTILLIIACLTMLTGVFGAASQMDFRRILSFHIISQIGYMILGLALFTPLGIAGGVFYIFHHIIVKTNLFFISGVVKEMRGTYYLKKLGGIYKLYPVLGLLFLIPAMSLGGIPPLSGFWAKFAVAKAGILSGEYVAVGISLFVGLLTLFSMIKIWNEVFWKDNNQENAGIELKEMPKSKVFLMFTPIVFLALITITIGLFPQPFIEIANEASAQLLNPKLYIHSVLGAK